MLYIFTGVNRLPDDFVDSSKDLLPKWRLDQMMSYRYPSDRKLCAMAYLILVYALKQEGLFNDMPEFEYHTDGKPFLSNYPNIHFNLSHCQDAVVCSLSKEEVGVDVENVREYDDELARVVCNDDEYGRIISLSDLNLRAKSFTELWTKKESVMKWRGTGLNCDPREIFIGDTSSIQKKDFQISSIYYQTENLYVSVCKKTIAQEQ
jgi:4'-phosphopantetheinyl transferase